MGERPLARSASPSHWGSFPGYATPGNCRKSAGERVVTIAEEMPGAIYFIVEPDREQLLELRTLVDAGELRAEVDSVFPLTEAQAAFERVAARGKRGKVVLEVGTD